jgi:hypothetical protein
MMSRDRDVTRNAAWKIRSGTGSDESTVECERYLD